MKNMPKIEWPKDRDPVKINKALSSITGLLNNLGKNLINSDSAFYIINPEPLSDIEQIKLSLSNIDLHTRLDEHYHLVRFGDNKSSGCACLIDPKRFELSLPVFFDHRPEQLNIIVMKNISRNFDPLYISNLCEFIFLRRPATMQAPGYIGMCFEADSLVEIHSNMAGIRIC